MKISNFIFFYKTRFDIIISGGEIMLTYHFPESINIPMYQYLYQQIKKDIENQKLKAHEKLPSKRSLAKNLQISLVTVENAYNQLVLEGYIYAIEKKGYYVSQLHLIHHDKRNQYQYSYQPQQAYLIDLKTNTVASSHFPFSTWSKLTRQVLSSQDSSLLKSTDPQGDIQLRKAISHHLYQFSGMDISPEQIVIGAGSEYLYNLIIQLMGRKLIYALENPGHKSIAKVYTNNDITCQLLSLDDKGIRMDQLYQSHAQIVHVSPAHHFPTGITMPITRRLELIHWAKEVNGYIIEDDYDSEFRLRGHPLSPLFQIHQGEHVIYMNTFSKTLAPSFRISYMVLPWHLLKIYQEKLGFYTCSVSHLEQMILARFIEEGYFEKHINRMRNHYKNIRNEFLKQLMHSDIAPSIQIKEENAGLHFLLVYQNQLTDKEMIQKAQKLSLNITTLSQFYEQSFESSTLLINYSGLLFKDIPIAVQLLNELLKS